MSVWGTTTGAWASAVEEEEQQHGSIQAPVVEQDFPTLGAAAAVKETKKDKKKKQTMSLSDFMSSGTGSRRLDDPILDLPTAPRGRREGDEDTGPSLGGGFRGYGGDRFGGRGGRFDDEERRPRRARDEEDLGPSRADAVDSWATERKFVPSDGPSGGYGDRYGSSRGGDRGFGFRDERPRRDYEDGPSRADTGDWGARQFVPSSSHERESVREPSRADLEDRWERREEHRPTGFDDRVRRGFDDLPPRERRGFADNWRGREREGFSGPSSRDGSRDFDTWRKPATETSTPQGPDASVEGPKERPKLMLKPRTSGTDTSTAPAATDSSSRPSIFGAARPREEVLLEQGKDPQAEEERLTKSITLPSRGSGRGDRKEEESSLQTKIEDVKRNIEAAGDDEEVKTAAEEELKSLEQQLEDLKVSGDGGDRLNRPPRSRGGGRENGSSRPHRDRDDRSNSFGRRDGASGPPPGLEAKPRW